MKPIVMTLLLAAAAWFVGCTQPVKTQGGERIEAVYSGRTLSARLPGSVSVQAFAAALDKVLRDRGYLVEKTSTTADISTTVARAPRRDNFPRITITARTGADATVVTLVTEPFGDQEQCRSILDAVLRELGL